MVSPKFSLQNVLDIRHGKVELLEIELGKLLAIRQETQNLMNSLLEYQAALFAQLGEAQTGEIDMVNLKLLLLNTLQVGEQLEVVKLELKKQSKGIEDKRIELIQAKQSEETLEILKRKRHEVYAAEQIQIEAQAQDDIYIARAFRNQQQQGA
jgi:flagellar export protein FliJ